MSTKTRFRAIWVVVVGIGVLGAACGSSSTTTGGGGTPSPSQGGGTPTASQGGGTPTQSSESPAPVENNPIGDIPDDTVFVTYRSDGGFRFKVPEGWARTTKKSSVKFTDKLNTVSASWMPASPAPTVASVKQMEVPQLEMSEPAFQLESVRSVSLPGGDAVLVTFQENSKANAVTGKQYRLDVQRFEFFSNGTEAVLTLSSPVGADNVDPWRLISESFVWS